METKAEPMYRFFKQGLDIGVSPIVVVTLLPVFLIILVAECAWALGPNEILVIANGSNTASVRIARYYCERRGVPKENILKLALNHPLNDTISRDSYDRLIAGPVRGRLASPEFSGRI